MDFVTRELNIKKMEDWYHIIYTQFILKGNSW